MDARASLLNYTEYKSFLRDLVKDPKAPRGLQSQLARVMGCQAAYLYQVLHGKVHLTEDQAFKLGRHLEFTAGEWEYFSTLWRIARASSPELIEHLKAQC